MLSATTQEKSEGHGAGVTTNALMAWFCFFALGMWTYHELAEKEFTAILTLSVFAQALSFTQLQMQISANKHVAGISGKTLIMHAMKLCCRLGTTLWLDGYLPTDKSGDWIYQVADVLSLLMVLQILFCVHVKHKATYQSEKDTLDIRNLIMVSFVLAVLVHPSMNAWTPFDILWTAHLYIDAVAMVPQLWMISKSGGRVSGFTAHYIAATLLSASLSGAFWFMAGVEFQSKDKGGFNVTALAINGAHLLQVLLLLDFGYQYVKSCLRGDCCAPDVRVKSSKNASAFGLKNSNAMIAWFGFACLGVWVYHEIAQKQFTVMLTISVFAQALSFLLLLTQISSSGSVAGISKRALFMHLCKLCCRMSTTLWLDGYLPTDKSGDWMYQVGDMLSLILVFKVLHCVHVTHKMSYQSEQDSMNIRTLLIGAVVLAALFHPTLNDYPLFDILWTVHLYVDAVAMVPQLWMITQAGGRVRGLTAHYIAATFLSNFLSASFWFMASSELHDEKSSINVAGLAVNGAHTVQLLLLLDFGYHYTRACLQGQGRSSNMYVGGGLSVDL